jgi:fatty acid/phospholipid biosynthesis enzyme
MVGLRGVVVKSHGRADRTAFARAIALARTAAIHDIPGCVAKALGSNSAEQGT